RKPAAILAAAVLLALAAVLAFRGWDRWVEDRLARWAAGEVARRSGGVYRLTLGDLGFLPLAGTISCDSASLTTDTVRNRRRARPLPVVAWRGHECRVAGLDVPRLLFLETFAARELGCRRAEASVGLITPEREERRNRTDAAAGDAPLDEARGLGLRSLRVSRIAFPSLRLSLARPGEDGGLSVLLEHARFAAEDIEFDPGATPGEERVLSAGGAHLEATGLVLRPDTLSEIAVARLEASFTDSTLMLAGAKREPPIPESEWARRVKVRKDRLTFTLDTLRARGDAWREFLATGDLAVRALELGGARLDVLSDRRIPRGPPRRHRTPQQWAASPGAALRIDSVVVTGSIAYRERRPERDRPGRVGFDGLRATVLNLDRPSRGRPLRIAARARVMDAGVLTVEATVPLDAPDFRYELAGRLGTMPAEAFNRFLSLNEPFEFEDGRVERIDFRQTAQDGRVRTVLTPRYRDLSVSPTGEGGGLLGDVVREVKELVANALVVRSRNPEENGEDLRVARTTRRYDPTSTWIQFLWFSLRDALMEGIKERPKR
ncbi:MAG TPA: hypothetical protein VFZ26_01325, partial [Gemmatimonadales bacterium]